jgi:hypothetical protein
MPNKYDIKSDVDTIKSFGYKPTKKTYSGSNPAGIPAYQRSITRIKDKHTGDEAVIRRSTKYGGSESQHSRTKETFEGPGSMMSDHWKKKVYSNMKRRMVKD